LANIRIRLHTPVCR